MKINAAFWDVGGVLLSNAWDSAQRRGVLEGFGLDFDSFERRHRREAPNLERGLITLDDYLKKTLPPKAPLRSFKARMFAQSTPHLPVLSLARRVAAKGRCFMATINNESRELNHYRIERFRLRTCFDAFLASCYLGFAKPDPRIFRSALDLTQRKASECLFIDDRPENVAAARRLGFQAIGYENAASLGRALRRFSLL